VKANRCLAPIFLLLAGCASTKVDVTGPGAGSALCEPRQPSLVLWTAQWRPDQKDAAGRETAAWQGIEQFFLHSSCFGRAEVHNASAPPAGATGFGRIIAITVRELGPVVRIGSPSLVEGGTEVVIETRVTDGNGRLLADLRTHWQHGGAFVIKGTGSLERDMTEALRATLRQ
jgi:hypothetical protein